MKFFRLLVLVSLMVACLALTIPGLAVAQPTYGAQLGQISVSADSASLVDCAVVSPFVIFSVYVLADIDYADIGDPGRNATDGVGAWEFSVAFDNSALILVSTVLPGGFPDFGNTFTNGTTTTKDIRYGAGQCVPVGGGLVVLAEIQFFATAPVSNQFITVGAATESSFGAAPGGDAPGWVECLPFTDVRYPFASSMDLTLNAGVIVDGDLEPTELTVDPLTDCSNFDVTYRVEENVACALPGPFGLEFRLSQDATIDATDIFLGGLVINSVPPGGAFGSINLALPPVPWSGDVYVGVIVDPGDDVIEVNEANNTLASGPHVVGGHQIQSIEDVPDDQGLQARINFLRSPFDALGSSTPIIQYEAFRRIDNSKEAVRHPDQLSTKTLGYEFVGAIPAHIEPEYNMVVPTLVDGVLTGFFIRAATASPGAYYDNCEAEVSTVDDLAPPPPAAFAADYAALGNTLSWSEVTVPDLVGYRLYRSTDPNFVPGPGNLVQETAALGLIDTVGDPFAQFYKLTAVDDAGNESPVVIPGQVTAADSSPSRFVLHDVIPNPFNPRTTAAFEVPTDAGLVRVAVYDLAGRLVRTLVDEAMTPGRHQVTWDGLDADGRSVSSGSYFLHMSATEFAATRKMMLVR